MTIASQPQTCLSCLVVDAVRVLSPGLPTSSSAPRALTGEAPAGEAGMPLPAPPAEENGVDSTWRLAGRAGLPGEAPLVDSSGMKFVRYCPGKGTMTPSTQPSM